MKSKKITIFKNKNKENETREVFEIVVDRYDRTYFDFTNELDNTDVFTKDYKFVPRFILFYKDLTREEFKQNYYKKPKVINKYI